MTRYLGRDRGRSSRMVLLSVAVLSICLLVGYAWIELNGGWKAQLPTGLRPMSSPQARVSKPQSSGPSVPWPTMVAFAEQEAAEIDKDAILAYTGLGAYPPGRYDYSYDDIYPGPLTGSLELYFSYYRPEGGSLFIHFEDAAPQDTLQKST